MKKNCNPLFTQIKIVHDSQVTTNMTTDDHQVTTDQERKYLLTEAIPGQRGYSALF